MAIHPLIQHIRAPVAGSLAGYQRGPACPHGASAGEESDGAAGGTGGGGEGGAFVDAGGTSALVEDRQGAGGEAAVEIAVDLSEPGGQRVGPAGALGLDLDALALDARDAVRGGVGPAEVEVDAA